MKTTIKKSVSIAVISVLVATGFAFTTKKNETKKEINCASSEQSVINYLNSHGFTIYSLRLANSNSCDRIADVQYNDDIYVYVTDAVAVGHVSIPNGASGGQ